MYFYIILDKLIKNIGKPSRSLFTQLLIIPLIDFVFVENINSFRFLQFQ